MRGPPQIGGYTVGSINSPSVCLGTNNARFLIILSVLWQNAEEWHDLYSAVYTRAHRLR